jgi:Mn-containing catalase
MKIADLTPEQQEAVNKLPLLQQHLFMSEKYVMRDLYEYVLQSYTKSDMSFLTAAKLEVFEVHGFPYTTNFSKDTGEVIVDISNADFEQRMAVWTGAMFKEINDLIDTRNNQNLK